MDQRTNYLSLILLDALDDENKSDINFILLRNSKDVDPSYVPLERGIAPIHFACGMQNERLATSVIARFLQLGANPNCRTNDKMTPLHAYGAHLEVYDNERKTPLLYAIEECNFEIVKIIRDHIFLKKYEAVRQMILSDANVINQRLQNLKLNSSSTPPKTRNVPFETQVDPNRNTLKENNAIDDNSIDSDSNKFTPNRVHYNYDITSPYYINITHRRHKMQPKFPPLQPENVDKEQLEPQSSRQVNPVEGILSVSNQNAIQSSSATAEAVNIFSLTEENLKELSEHTAPGERSRKSLIENWREKVRESRARKSICKEFDNVIEMINEFVESDSLNFTNTKLNEKEKTPKKIVPQAEIEVDDEVVEQEFLHFINTRLNEKEKTPKTIVSQVEIEADNGAWGPAPSTTNNNEHSNKISSQKHETYLSKLIQAVTEAKVQDFEPDCLQIPQKTSPQQTDDMESSYQTVPEITVTSPNKTTKQIGNLLDPLDTNDYFIQLTEAYVHTDDDNGLVFYETKWRSNIRKQEEEQAKDCAPKTPGPELESTTASQSTNLTLPLDYDTDRLRAELTNFDEPPGPITKSTKRIYLKRLIKYKRNKEIVNELAQKNKNNLFKFSVELHRTVKSEDFFRRIQDYMQYEKKSLEYFESSENKKQMREGHLKQSFVYMLIDPRISCNLPGESVFLKEFDIWQRFLQSIFYVGKGKTSRPYSHLYDAMKYHSRLHDRQLQRKKIEEGKRIAFKKKPINMDIFKSPPQKSSDSKKLDRILNIWSTGHGVVSLHVFHNIIPIDAYTREAAIIDALSLQHLTNCKRGDYYGPAKTWTMREKKYLGIALLFKAMRIYVAEGESQLSPSDLL
ncbi:hypothetical protein DOY81_003839 [Sarcophaga bullata]|nr:hypothetical protein DOY81_003839 [Sarcophaga bullata]